MDKIEIILDSSKYEVTVKINDEVYKSFIEEDPFAVGPKTDTIIDEYLQTNNKTSDDIVISVTNDGVTKQISRLEMFGNLQDIDPSYLSEKTLVLRDYLNNKESVASFVGEVNGKMVLAVSATKIKDLPEDVIDGTSMLSIGNGLVKVAGFTNIEKDPTLPSEFRWVNVMVYNKQDLEYAYMIPAILEEMVFYFNGKMFYATIFKYKAKGQNALNLIKELVPRTLSIIFKDYQECLLDFVIPVPVHQVEKEIWMNKERVLTTYANSEIEYAIKNNTGFKRYTLVNKNGLVIEFVEMKNMPPSLFDYRNDFINYGI
jgi:hypothetical protein